LRAEILQGDCIEVLRTLPDESVNCCVTSPPYYGLRDYGTARWEGGDPECDHKGKPMSTHAGFNERYFGRPPKDSDKQGELLEFYKDKCPKCGAIRIDNQIGLEQSPDEYIAKLVEVFREVRRVLRNDGTLWLHLGDSYASYKDCKSVDDTLGAGSGRNVIDKEKSVTRSTVLMKAAGYKNKDLMMIPARIALALQADGWWLRSDIIWAKPNPMPESVTDRPTKAHEYIFLLAKSQRYYYDAEAVKEDSLDPESYTGRRPRKAQTIVLHDAKNHKFAGSINDNGEYRSGMVYQTRNRRSVWTVSTQPYPEAHFATFPPKLIEPCVLAGCPAGGVVLDPFNGSGTTGAVALRLGRDYIGIELNPDYIEFTNKRLAPILAQPSLLEVVE